jgi:hypothetical protein
MEQHGSKGKQTMPEELRDKARALGLDRLTKEHLAQFAARRAGWNVILQRLPRRMPAAQELARVYRAKGESDERRSRLSRAR